MLCVAKQQRLGSAIGGIWLSVPLPRGPNKSGDSTNRGTFATAQLSWVAYSCAKARHLGLEFNQTSWYDESCPCRRSSQYTTDIPCQTMTVIPSWTWQITAWVFHQLWWKRVDAKFTLCNLVLSIELNRKLLSLEANSTCSSNTFII
jgi:hypothetical protein